MSILVHLVEALVRRLKREPGYTLGRSFCFRDLSYVLGYRLTQTFRGMRMRFKLGKCVGILFCGRYVVVEHGYKISAGKSLILEDQVRINALSERGVILGRNVTIKAGAIIVCSGVIKNMGIGLKVGNDSAIGSYSYIAAQGGIEIGSNVIIGPGVMIFSEDHNYSDEDEPIRLQGESREKVRIEDDCWIGGGATILKGVTVGRGSVIAAGAVVKNHVPAYSVVAGVPGRVVKHRKKTLV
jgi:acetyltransferase-like isoleucine patch superfamily enzyme